MGTTGSRLKVRNKSFKILDPEKENSQMRPGTF
jgi:hypothetical protein